MNNIIIRQATLADAEAVTAIEATCFPAAEAASFISLSDRLQAFTTSFLVAETAGQVIGFINGCITNQTKLTDDLYESTDKHNLKGLNMMVFGLDVLPSYQHQGIAQKLMKAYIKIGKQMYKKVIILTCKEKLIPFYEQFGYVCHGVSSSTHGGATWYDMSLTL